MGYKRRFPIAFAVALAVHLSVGLLKSHLTFAPQPPQRRILVAPSIGKEQTLDVSLAFDYTSANSNQASTPVEPASRSFARQSRPLSTARARLNQSSIDGNTSVNNPIPLLQTSDSTAPTQPPFVVGKGENIPDRLPSPTLSPSTALTREQLGLSPNSHLAREKQSSPILRDMKARIATNETLSKSIQQDAVERSGELGLGPEGPILSKLEKLALSNSGIGNGFVTLSVRILDGGKLDFELLGSSTDNFQWLKLLEQAKRELQAQKLSPPVGSHGVEYEIRLESRVQLPSGADPGFFVDLFGRTLKKGEGKRSNGVSILSSLPKLKVDESALGMKDRTLAQRLEADIVKVPLDPADLSGKRSRIVSARVVRRTVL